MKPQKHPAVQSHGSTPTCESKHSLVEQKSSPPQVNREGFVLWGEGTALRVFLHSPDLFASRCFFWHTHGLDGLPFVGVDPEKHTLSCLKPSSHCFPWTSIMCEVILMIFEGVTTFLSYCLCLTFWPKVWFQSTCVICVKTAVFQLQNRI